MKKIMFLLSVAAVGLLFAGCASVEAVQNPNLNGENISLSGTPVAHLNAQNWGIYLFSIPLLTGSTDAVGSIAVLQDTVNVDSMIPVITAKSKELKASQTLDLASLDSFVVAICIEGCGTLTDDSGAAVPVHQGETVLIPASARSLAFTPDGGMKILTSWIG